ncbi:pentapeptide repeat-containing protein [Amycolatopsis sp. NBC_01488]|uniref:pentapeptide repeat-containing protein n=1 Tax=Amycolatopsis sp. NBC_01488 TaxID=2903563 RepID=UPI002E2939EA|nr:pentapeptide repeat-containing protein [Amycolatopsis sp. NBC_01488]
MSAATFLGDAHIRWTGTDRPEGDDAYFVGATFTGDTYFDGSPATGNLYLSGATFLGDVYFSEIGDNPPGFTGNVYCTDTTFMKKVYFSRTKFAGDVYFTGTAFEDDAYFTEVTFTNGAYFSRTSTRDREVMGDPTHFAKDVHFDRTTFRNGSDFSGAIFDGDAYLTRTAFAARADFAGATFARDAFFSDSRFATARFHETTFAKGFDAEGSTFDHLDFSRAKFDELQRLGPLVADSILLTRASFKNPVVIEAETTQLSCGGARFTGGAELRVRHGRVDLAEAFFGSASSLSTSAARFSSGDDRESADHRPVLMSLRSTDVSELALTDVDVRWCRFAGAHHLDKLRIEGVSLFHKPPRGRWRTSRQVLFEEHLWRAGLRPREGWLSATPWEPQGGRAEDVGAERLAAVYRSLRKALEDGKNEAGAGDFYYGEQEARRRADATSRVEKIILWAYWLISGYGQRASRATAALLLLVAVVTSLLIGFGLPSPGPASQSTTTTTSSQTVTTTVDLPAQLPPAGQRWTWRRAGDATRIALGAVVFRDAGQKLTTTGTWTVMVARFLGPLLLALTALAIRARVKR